ncbi:unnamed protein product [Notodromas monacha]|uniref:Methionine synthase reductase n=1 Tax=Notodromas monacha TaxID=399045 RepID=A0A7R9BLL1_9CRUS|nr:unnamed protein product [Notodromas monacha]CAG0917460.1 unnamed protein product [Notodromas monacha]
MLSKDVKRCLLIYASETGQAKSIAEEIQHSAQGHGFFLDVKCVSRVDREFDLTEEKVVIVLASTTGDGEPPETARKFYRRLKQKSLPSDHLGHLKFALLALGDTNYTNFCNFGKSVNRRLLELGAQSFCRAAWADDAIGLEVVVEPWIEDLFRALHLEFADSKSCRVCDSLFAEQFCNFEMDGVTLAHSPNLAKLELNLPPAPAPFLSIEFRDFSQDENRSHHLKNPPSLDPDSEGVFSAKFLNTVELTMKNADKLKYEIEFRPEKEITWREGDSFGLFCPNPSEEVNLVLERCGVSTQDSIREFIITKDEDTKKKVPDHLPVSGCSLVYVFTYCCSIRMPLKKAFLMALADCCENDGEKRRLLELSSRQGAAEYSKLVSDAGLTLFDLLETFISLKPDPSRLLEHFPRLQPRAYSAVYSSDICKSLKFAYTYVEFPESKTRSRRQFGVCSSWLRDKFGPDSIPLEDLSLEATHAATDKIWIYKRKSTGFHLPENHLDVPVILIGPGTGVAPYIGFLAKRKEDLKRAEKDDFKPAQCWLFFGCRHQERDFLYEGEIRKYLEEKVLDKVFVAVSGTECGFILGSSNTDQELGSCKYVQDAVRMVKHDVREHLVKNSGHVFVCGDAVGMGKAVQQVFMEILAVEGSSDPSKNEEFERMIREKRYHQDIWTSEIEAELSFRELHVLDGHVVKTTGREQKSLGSLTGVEDRLLPYRCLCDRNSLKMTEETEMRVPKDFFHFVSFPVLIMPYCMGMNMIGAFNPEAVPTGLPLSTFFKYLCDHYYYIVVVPTAFIAVGTHLIEISVALPYIRKYQLTFKAATLWILSIFFIGFPCLNALRWPDPEKIKQHLEKTGRSPEPRDSTVKVRLDDGEKVEIEKQTHETSSEKQFYHIQVEEDVNPGEILDVHIPFRGRLAEGFQGFFHVNYEDRDGSKDMVATHFQPTSARAAFPCFDEPHFKTPFKINVARPKYENLQSFSNMPIVGTKPVERDERYIWDVFDTSPPMPTYLVTFVVADFTVYTASDWFQRLICRESMKEEMTYALKILPYVFYEVRALFRAPYALPKLDHLAIVGWNGGMEHYGLITYGEDSIAVDYDIEGLEFNRRKNMSLSIICHETCHMWLGNLVTTKWWDTIWLNEGITQFFTHYVAGRVDPNSNLAEMLPISLTERAMLYDAERTAIPMVESIEKNSEIPRAFSAKRTYYRGAAITNMLMHIMSETRFISAIVNYVKKFAHKSVGQEDFFDEMDSVARIYMRIPRWHSIDDIMGPWTKQVGFPLVTVNRDYDRNMVTYSQKRFRNINGNLHSDETKWVIPITFTTEVDKDFTATSPEFWLAGQSTEKPLKLDDDDWLLVNVQRVGYYRVNYDTENWMLLVEQLQRDPLEIHVINRAQLISDAFVLASYNLVDWKVIEGLAEYLKNEEDFLPWLSASKHLYALSTYLPDYKDHREWATQLILDSQSKLMSKFSAASIGQEIAQALEIPGSRKQPKTINHNSERKGMLISIMKKLYHDFRMTGASGAHEFLIDEEVFWDQHLAHRSSGSANDSSKPNGAGKKSRVLMDCSPS